MSIWSELKFKVSKNRLRQIKNSIQDDIDSMKYRSVNIYGDASKHSIATKQINTKFILDKIDNNTLFSNEPLKIAFIVTEEGETASAGDYFTAIEFGEFLKKLGWHISFIPHHGQGYWYHIPDDVDVVISLLDRYDPNRIKSLNQSLIKIAWPRNWFDRWVSHPSFKKYDMVFAPSKTAQEYINKFSNKKPILLPLATNPKRFNENIPQNQKYLCDYCFTGSYWNDPRDIIEMLEPDNIPYKFNLYGKNWDKIPKFKKYYHGFIPYSKLPEVYASTKIVIDDANRATKKYGSVNSRVYDALACGALVITNGKKGALETFKGKLPVFNSNKELNYQLVYYLSNEDERRAKIKELQEFVLEKHTYANRAETLEKNLVTYLSTLNPQ